MSIWYMFPMALWNPNTKTMLKSTWLKYIKIPHHTMCWCVSLHQQEWNDVLQTSSRQRRVGQKTRLDTSTFLTADIIYFFYATSLQALSSVKEIVHIMLCGIDEQVNEWLTSGAARHNQRRRTWAARPCTLASSSVATSAICPRAPTYNTTRVYCSKYAMQLLRVDNQGRLFLYVLKNVVVITCADNVINAD